MRKNIAVLSGDGIGPEVMREAMRVLEFIAAHFEHQFVYHEAKIGGAAFDVFQTHCPDETLQICEGSDAILFGSVGGPVAAQHLPKWHHCEANSILKLRQHFKFNINIRPVQMDATFSAMSPLKKELLEAGIDMLIFRELNGDLYFGKHDTIVREGLRVAIDEAIYAEDQIRTIARAAFEAAKERKQQLVSVDKANVLATSQLWRTVVTDVGKDYPTVQLSHMLVDNCAMQLVLNPGQFDVLLTPNMFGDILSDLAAALPGSVGLIPSASLNAAGFGLYEPSGGSAPDIVGLGLANPIAQIRSVAMMLRHSFQLYQEASCIEKAIQTVLAQNIKTRDMARQETPFVTTTEFTDALLCEMAEGVTSLVF